MTQGLLSIDAQPLRRSLNLAVLHTFLTHTSTQTILVLL